jgi:hypothetical protein
MFTDLKIPAGRRPMSPAEARISAIVGIVFTIMILFAVFEDYSVQRLSVVLVLLFWVPMLVLHELGHAIVARLLGWRVREIVIGFGRDLWQWQIGETRIRVKLAPVEGYVLPAPKNARYVRAKSMLIYAAGPGAELLLLGILLQIFGWEFIFDGSGELLQVVLQSLAIAILLGAGFNLLPFSTDGAVSDGLGIISSPFLSDTSIELRLLTFELREMQAMLDAGDASQAVLSVKDYLGRFPSNSPLQHILVSALSTAGETEEARESIRDKLSDATLSEESREAWLYQQARIELDAETPSWLVLDLALQKALARSPRDSGLLATKGAALILRGQAKEGGEMLADVWRRNNGNVLDAEVLAYLTIAAYKVGNRDASAEFGDAFMHCNRSIALANRVRQLTGQGKGKGRTQPN